ncbi:alpha/beta hydrolase [Parvularcula lutaonensis]|uniref:Alpha/beta hydrolase n=1 Tax=Parvularcula lutaonensis TaxID=491923 RepID=A0ABV7MA75_9PROT|nr:alpha/beta hydrolase [Parvularcula lutaonensis]GGY36921.1 esterase [Parvularcula lutaonensis]
MKRFRNSRSWKRYKAVIREAFGINLTVEPNEMVRDIRCHRVRIDEWLPDGVPRGTLLAVHGGGGNGRILAPLCEPAAALGWRVLAPDLPGYGLTRPAKGYRGDYGEWIHVIAELAGSEPGPVVLMGLSMGGLTAFLAAQESRNVAGVIATTLLDLSDPEVFVHAARWRWLGRFSLFSMSVMPWVFDRFTMPLFLATPLAAMSDDRRVQDYFRTDRLLGASWKSARFFRTVHQHRITRWDCHCPLLLVHPGADAWTPTRLSLAVFDRIEADKRFVELSNGSHLPLEQPANDELMRELAGFLGELA